MSEPRVHKTLRLCLVGPGCGGSALSVGGVGGLEVRVVRDGRVMNGGVVRVHVTRGGGADRGARWHTGGVVGSFPITSLFSFFVFRSRFLFPATVGFLPFFHFRRVGVAPAFFACCLPSAHTATPAHYCRLCFFPGTMLPVPRSCPSSSDSSGSNLQQ